MGNEKKTALKSYRDLSVWQKAMDLVENIYLLTRQFPEEEKLGLVSQIRRACVSVPANIAEGYGRTHRGDYLHHLSVANGSLMETETLLTIAARLKFANREDAATTWGQLREVGKMLTRLLQSLQTVGQKPRHARSAKPDTPTTRS